jgi:nucleoside-diphosphate-sugar epimerase
MDHIITGATGFIGKAITQKLFDNGKNVTAFVRRTSNIEYLKNNNIPFVYGDLNDLDSLKKAFKGHKVLIHAAGFVSDWGKKKDYIKANYIGIKNVLEACIESGIKRVVYFSTVDVYGGIRNVVINEKMPLKGSIPGWYPKSKILAEKFVRDYMENNLLDISIVYPSWVYGEGDQHFIPEIIQALKDGSMMFFRKCGNHVLDIVYLENLVAAILYILENDQTIGNRFILSDNPKIKFRDFVNTIANLIGCKEVKFTLPYPIAYSVATIIESVYRVCNFKSRPLLTRNTVYLLGNNIMYDNSNLKSFGYIQPYSFEEGINKTIKSLM